MMQQIRQHRSLWLVLAVVAIIAAIWTCLLITSSAHKTLDQRTQDVAVQLKCPVCQGESVADSPSLLAGQMRAIIRQQLSEGKSEPEVVQYFVNRYGAQIAWSPPWQGFALLAWLVPMILLPGGGVVLFLVLRDWRTSVSTPGPDDVNRIEEEALAGLSEDELEHYRVLLEQELVADDPLYARYRSEA